MVSHTENFSHLDSSDLERIFEDEKQRLETVERRLGTIEELPSDFEEARCIAHRISNLRTLLSLRSRNEKSVSVI